MSSKLIKKTLFLLTMLFMLLPFVQAKETQSKSAIQLKGSFVNQPVFFTQNKGQWDEEVKYAAKGPGYTIFFTDAKIVSVFLQKSEKKEENNTYILRQSFLQSNDNVTIENSKTEDAKINFFIGTKKNWKTNIPTSSEITYKNIYDGIDAVYSFKDTGELKSTYVVKAGADPNQIRLDYGEKNSLEVSAKGTLIIKTERGDLIEGKPFVYQIIQGKKREIESSYVIKSNEYRFKVGSYDKSLDLIIDPVLDYSTYLGGGSWDIGRNITVDPTGNIYVSGRTTSIDFPTSNPLFPSIASTSGYDIFVSKFTPDYNGWQKLDQ